MIRPMTKLEQYALPGKGAVVSGPFGSNIGSRFFVDVGVPIIRGNNLTKGERRFIDDGFVFLTEEKASEFKNCEALAGDLVFTAAGTIGQVGVIPHNSRFERYIISNKQLRFRCDLDKANPWFVYYWFCTAEMRQYIISPVLIERSRLPFRYPRRAPLRSYGMAANTSLSSASANVKITSRIFPRNASLNGSGPKRASLWSKDSILFPIGVFLLGLTPARSQLLVLGYRENTPFLFFHHDRDAAGRSRPIRISWIH